MHRLNRAEYANAIRDLLGLEIDATALLPPDDESSGFDNIADVLRVSPSLMERYLSASWNISRAGGGKPEHRARHCDLSRPAGPLAGPAHRRAPSRHARRNSGAPQLSRGRRVHPQGSALAQHLRPDARHGRLRTKSKLAWTEPEFGLVTVGGKEDFVKMAENPGIFGADVDQRLTVRLPVKAGAHIVSATTILRSHAQKDDLIKPFLRTTVDGLDITGDPSIDRLNIEGPFNQTGPGDTASRRQIFVCRPATPQRRIALRAHRSSPRWRAALTAGR